MCLAAGWAGRPGQGTALPSARLSGDIPLSRTTCRAAGVQKGIVSREVKDNSGWVKPMLSYDMELCDYVYINLKNYFSIQLRFINRITC